MMMLTMMMMMNPRHGDGGDGGGAGRGRRSRRADGDPGALRAATACSGPRVPLRASSVVRMLPGLAPRRVARATEVRSPQVSCGDGETVVPPGVCEPYSRADSVRLWRRTGNAPSCSELPASFSQVGWRWFNGSVVRAGRQ
jgi:hypothetical protein